MITAVVAAIAIAFPRAGQKLPSVSRCYMIGATSGGETNLVVQGRDVAVHPQGGWVTMVDCVEGTNWVSVAGSNHWFWVAKRPVAVSKPASTNRAPAKVWKKLPYAGDTPRRHPATNETVTVVVDAGHGGTDTGALSPHSLPEKDANLKLAKVVRDELVARGVRVVMTREDDSFPALYDRPKVAHKNGAAAFVSIHHNAPPYDKDPRLLRYTAVYAWNEIGTRLATCINGRMADAVAAEGLKNNGVPHANFAVMRNPEIPSCLVETDFITTPEGELACWDPERRKRLAGAIADGILDWIRAGDRPKADPR